MSQGAPVSPRVVRSVLYPTHDSPYGLVYAKLNPSQSQILHYASKDTISTRKKNIFRGNIDLKKNRMTDILNFGHYENARQLQSGIHRI